jgi:multisubunit Na+/H+ antiporter MnhC subunit
MISHWKAFLEFAFFVIMLSLSGVYCILATRSLMRTLIGLEMLIKAVTLLIIIAGYSAGCPGLAQAVVITLIVIEVIVVAIAAGVILCIYRESGSLDVRDLKKLKG